jgi:protein XagA
VAEGSGQRVGRLVARAGIALALLLLARSGAFAGAWTLPQGTGQLIQTFTGWGGDGAPWGGQPGVQQWRGEAGTYVQYGVSDTLTIFGQTALERYVLTQPESSGYTGLDYSELGLRHRLWASGEWVVSGEATLFLPGAYSPSSPAQAGNTGGAGEGRLLVGTNYAFGVAKGFVDLEGAYRLRSAGPPDEWHGDVTLGLELPYGAMLLAQDFNTISSPSKNLSFPAWRSSLVEISLVLPPLWRWRVQLGWFQTVAAFKTNTERGVTLAFWRDF